MQKCCSNCFNSKAWEVVSHSQPRHRCHLPRDQQFQCICATCLWNCRLGGCASSRGPRWGPGRAPEVGGVVWCRMVIIRGHMWVTCGSHVVTKCHTTKEEKKEKGQKRNREERLPPEPRVFEPHVWSQVVFRRQHNPRQLDPFPVDCSVWWKAPCVS